MFVIMVYDIGEERVAKILKTSRKYLNWVQNSVFEGDLTQAKMLKLQSELKEIMKKKQDSVIFYTFKTKKYHEKIVIGVDKSPVENIL